MAIPVGTVILSGHGTADDWLKFHASVGDAVTLPTCATGGAAPVQVLPDLGMKKFDPNRFLIANVNGVKQLKFDTVVQNAGQGKFEIIMNRKTGTGDPMVDTQRIYYTDGSFTTKATTATGYFAGDGHNHWHVRDLEKFSLHLKDASETQLRTGAKHGFCFEDNTAYYGPDGKWPGSAGHPNSPASPVYVGCGSDPNATSQVMGMSVGWGDTYPNTLPDQFIDITGLQDGLYRLKVTADAPNWFAESNEANNTTWSDIQITGNTVAVTASGGGI